MDKAEQAVFEKYHLMQAHLRRFANIADHAYGVSDYDAHLRSAADALREAVNVYAAVPKPKAEQQKAA